MATAPAPVKTHPTSALRSDTWTCGAVLSLIVRRRRGWGVRCRTVNVIPENGGTLLCSFCGQVGP